MERLTHKAMYEAGYKANRNVMTWECIDKLGELEDAEEKGELLRLPIGIGKPCYVIEKCTCGLHYRCKGNAKADARRKGKIIEGKTDRMHHCIKIFERPFKETYLNGLGNKVFATEAEAVEKAQELLETQ